MFLYIPFLHRAVFIWGEKEGIKGGGTKFRGTGNQSRKGEGDAGEMERTGREGKITERRGGREVR